MLRNVSILLSVASAFRFRLTERESTEDYDSWHVFVAVRSKRKRKQFRQCRYARAPQRYPFENGILNGREMIHPWEVLMSAAKIKSNIQLIWSSNQFTLITWVEIKKKNGSNEESRAKNLHVASMSFCRKDNFVSTIGCLALRLKMSSLDQCLRFVPALIFR